PVAAVPIPIAVPNATTPKAGRAIPVTIISAVGMSGTAVAAAKIADGTPTAAVVAAAPPATT
ncbi:unnamed protein product, partial [Rotaria sp. Silwood1]